MTIKVSHLKLQEEAIVEHGLQLRALDPVAPVQDQIWWNTTSNKLKVYDGGITKLVSNGSGSINTVGAATIASIFSDLARSMGAWQINGLPAIVGSTEILDDFQQDLGTKTGCNSSSGVLNFNGATNTYTYLRTRKVSPTTGNVVAAVAMNLAAAAPNTATTTQAIFSGDFTQYFPNGKVFLVSMISLTENMTLSQFAKNSDGSLVNFTVSAIPVYTALTNSTTVLFTSPAATDPTFGLMGADVRANVRFIPFDYLFEGKSNTSAAYETLVVDQINNLGITQSQGDSYYTRLGTNSGAASNFIYGVSKNSQHVVLCMHEYTTGAKDIVRHYVSNNYGKQGSFQKLTIDYTLNGDTGFRAYTNPSVTTRHRIAVANNGLFIASYPDYTSNWQSRAIMGNTSSPTVTQMGPTFGANPATTAGYVSDAGGTQSAAYPCIDPETLSWYFWMRKQDNAASFVDTFDNTGSAPVYKGTATFSGDHYFYRPGTFQVFPLSNGQFRLCWFFTYNSSDQQGMNFIDSGAPTISNSGLVNNGVWWSTAASLIDSAYVNGRIYVLLNSPNSQPTRIAWRDACDSLTPTTSTSGSGTWNVKTVIDYVADMNYNIGTASNDERNSSSYNSIDSRMIVDPANSKHIFVLNDYITSYARHTILSEIKDVENFQGKFLSTGQDSSFTLGDQDPTDLFIAQRVNFNSSSNPFRSMMIKIKVDGSYPRLNPTSGYIEPRIYDVGTDGKPGAEINVAWRGSRFPLEKLFETTLDECFFNFPDGINLNGRKWVGFNIVGANLSAATYLRFAAVSGTTYPDGAVAMADSGGVSLVPDYSLTFSMYDVWHNDLLGHRTLQGDPRNTGANFYSGGSQMRLMSNTQIKVIYRPVNYADDVRRASNGLPYSRTVSIAQTGKSLISDAIPFHTSAALYDPNLVFNVAFGMPDHARNFNPRSGEPTDGFLENSLAGHGEDPRTGARVNITGANFINSPDMWLGRSMVLSASGPQYLAYGDNRSLQLERFSFFHEIQGKLYSYQATSRWIGGKYDITAPTNSQYGFEILPSGFVRSTYYDAASATVKQCVSSSQAIPLNTMFRLKITKSDNGSVRHYVDFGSGWNETTYSTPLTNLSRLSVGGTVGFFVGTGGNTTGQEWDGEIAYWKIGVGSDTPVYDGYRPQAHLLDYGIFGQGCLARRTVGNIDSPTTSQWNYPVIIYNDSAKVDIYNQLVVLRKSFATPGTEISFRITGNRGGSDNKSSISGVVAKFYT